MSRLCFKENSFSSPFSCSAIFSIQYKEKVASHKYRQEVNFDKEPYSRYNEEKVTKDKSMTNSKYITRLKRSEGQLRGIQKMIEEDRDCADIITQLTAVRSSVERVIEMMITENLTACINQPLDDPEAQKERLEKAVQYLIKRK